MVGKIANCRRSLVSDRELVEMAKTMDLNTIVKKTGRPPESILKTAMRLGVSIKGRKACRNEPQHRSQGGAVR